MLFTRSVLGAVCVGALAVPGAAQGLFKSSLPKNTLVYVSAPDIASTMKEFRSTPLFKMWKEQEMQDFFGQVLEIAEEKWSEGLGEARKAFEAGQFPLDPDKLLKLRVNGVGFALTGINVEMMKRPSGSLRANPKIGVMAYLDFGPTADQWAQVLKVGSTMLEGQAGGMLARSVTDVEGVKLHALRPKNSVMGLHWATIGSGLLVGTLESEVRAALTNMMHKTASLTAGSGYQATAQYLSTKGAEMEVFVQPNMIIEQIMTLVRTAKQMGDMPEEFDVDGVDRALTALGLRSINSMGATSTYKNGKSVTQVYTHAPKQQRRGLFGSASKPLDLSFLKWVPTDAANFFATSMDVGRIYSSVIDAMKAYDKDMAEMMLAQVAQMEEKIGLTLKDDLFGAFGDHMVFWSMGIMNFMQAPQWGILMKVKDEGRVLKAMQTLTKMSQGMLELTESKKRGVQTWILEANPDEVGDIGNEIVWSIVKFCFTFKDGYMVAALSPSHVRQAVKRMTPKEGRSSVLANESFAAYKETIPSGITALSWTDWKVTFENFYQASTSLLMLVPQSDDIPFDMKKLPEGETLSKHLFGEVSWTKVDDNGFSMTTVSPVGPEILVGIGAAVGAGAAMFSMRMGGEGPMVMEEAEAADEAIEEEKVEVEEVDKAKGKKNGKDK